MARMLFLCIVHASILKCLSMAISTSGPMAPGTSMQQSMTHAETSTINRNKKKKTTVMDVSLVKYLRKFKYLDPSPCPSCDQDSSIISEALSTLQQWAHINNTGILDSDTVEVMSKRRCGVPDEPKQFSVSSVKTKRHKRGFFWQIYHGSRWYKNDLTYIINMPHKFPNKRAVEKIISAALHAWESVTQLTFTQKRYGYADIEVNFLTGRHGDGSPFDGNGGILAHAFFPYDNSPGLSGDAHFDADEDWGSEMDLNTTADLYCVAVHEFGHSLGLMHSRWPISIMWPWMKGDCTLSKFDIAVIQKIYGGADAKKNRPFQVVGVKKRVKMFKPRFRQKMRMQQFIQNLLYSTMRMIPRQGPPKPNLLTTPNPHQNAEVSMKTLSSPPTDHVLSHVMTPSFKAETYLIPEALSHKFLSAQTSPTTQKWTGDTQRNLPQILNFQAQDSPRNDLHDPLRVLSIDQQTTPLLLMMQNPLEQKQPLSKGQGYNDRNSKLQASSLLPYRLKAAISDQENVQTTSETIFRKIVTPHHQQQMAPMSIYMKKLKESQDGTVSSSRIHKRSLGESTPNHVTTLSENWMSKYSPIVTTFPSFVSQSTLHSHQVDIVNSSPGGDNSITNISERYSQYSERDGIKTPTMPTPNPKTFMLRKPWCSGSVEIDGATVDGNGTINIFKDSNVMRFPFCARNNSKKRTFIPISKVFPNGPNNVTAAATIVLGKKRKWERTYLFQGQLVWRYRKCLRRYCLDRGYPTNTSQEFNISTPIEITAAYMHNRRRTLFLFNGTSLYHTVRCLRWLRKSGCSSTETEMQPGLLSSLRSVDAMFTHQGNFYVVHGGSYFTKMLRSMKNNIFTHGSIAESWYGCQRKTF